MKKLYYVLVSLLIIVLFVFSACGDTQGSSLDSAGKVPDGVNYPAEDIDDQESTTDSNEQEKYFTVIFDTDGGSSIESQNVKSGGKAVKPSDPTKVRTGNVIYSFAGWFVGDTPFDFDSEITENITITAKWDTESYSDFVS